MLHPVGARRQTCTACIIARNEEKNLPALMESLRGIFDQIVLVATGSRDRTSEIARQYSAEVHDFPWVDSFAAARNEALRGATSDWIFWMDADDRLDQANRQKLLALLNQLDQDLAAYVMQCVCVADRETGVETVVQHVRLFRNHPHLRW
jgi:glycosyltransferase involved in cell wall biosynthesis